MAAFAQSQDEQIGLQLVQQSRQSAAAGSLPGDRASCYACHAIGYFGGKVGPNLTSSGRICSDRDLLEAITL